MTTFTLTIDTSSPAFNENPKELQNILAHAYAMVSSGSIGAPLRDSNGTTVGNFKMEYET